MAKPELGTKRVCPSCGTKYYDLKRDPITCPNCGTVFEITVSAKAAPAVAKAVVIKEVEPETVEREPDVISLEEADEEVEADVPVDGDEEEAIIPEAEALEVETEAAPEDEAAFLPEEEEEGDDVTGLLDVNAENEDEV